MLVFDARASQLVQASANAGDYLRLPVEPNVGLEELSENLAFQVRSRVDQALTELGVSFRVTLPPGDSQEFDVLMHRNADGLLILEFLRASPTPNLAGLLQESLGSIPRASSLSDLCDTAAEQFFALTGYDRVMVYRFDSDGHGQVFAETFEKDLEPYLGNHYPASDIPQIARRLYLRNRVRLLADVDYQPVPLQPRLVPSLDRDLDMSMCFLRSISPIHTQYLRNMGVAATLVISLVVGGDLWGLIACHHYSPRVVSHSVCAACELLAESISTRIAALEGFAQAQADLLLRRFENHMLESLSRYGDWKTALFNGSRHLLAPVEASGAVLFLDHEIHTAGIVPAPDDLDRLQHWLVERRPDPVFVTTSLGEVAPEFADLAATASGLIAVPVSSTPNEFLLWFRPEQVHTEVWGGDPRKAVVMGDDPTDLSPRRSFAKWHEEVVGRSAPWTRKSIGVASRIGESIADMVLHLRSVSALIAEDQVNKVKRQVARSDVPVILTNAGRRVLVANEAFQRLLPPGHPHIDRLEDLPCLFADPDQVRERIIELCDLQQPWRGRVDLVQENGERLPLVLRADPVQVPPQRLLGFVLVFNDVSEQEAVAAARRRFQEGILSGNGQMGAASELPQEVIQLGLVGLVVENAMLAALEIADGIDVENVAVMLDTVSASVRRSRALVEHLIGQDPAPDPTQFRGRRD